MKLQDYYIFLLKICRVDFEDIFPGFQDYSYLRAHNQISDFLVRIARSFHRVFYFIGCSIPV